MLALVPTSALVSLFPSTYFYKLLRKSFSSSIFLHLSISTSSLHIRPSLQTAPVIPRIHLSVSLLLQRSSCYFRYGALCKNLSSLWNFHINKQRFRVPAKPADDLTKIRCPIRHFRGTFMITHTHKSFHLLLLLISSLCLPSDQTTNN